MNIIANIIYILHVSLVIFNIITPFITTDPFILVLYCLTLTTILSHWYLNNDTCIMTKLESYIRGTHDNNTFIGQLVKPVYNISSKEIHIITILLLIYGFYRLRIWDKKRFELVKSNIINLHVKIFTSSINYIKNYLGK